MPRQSKAKSRKANAPPKRGRGQPEKEIDLKQLETLCQMQCTSAEIAAFFNCSVKTIERHKAAKPEFMEAMDNGRLKGLVSLRRAMFQSALNGNVTSQIWLSKNHLGMRDKFDVQDTDSTRGKVVIGLPDGEQAETKPLNADALQAAGKCLPVQ
jgi:hypothetical protein